MSAHHQILILGGGAAGITVAAQLRNQDPSLDVAILEPSEKHYYQPLWTLVGGGLFPKEESERDEAELIPQGATWIRDFAETIDPESRTVTTRSGDRVGYEFLVVAAGIQVNWDQIPGLRESIGSDGVCSNYAYETVDSTWKAIRSFRGGTAIFTHPPGAVKCGGAPQKIMYLAEEAFRRQRVRDQARVVFAHAGARIFPVEPYVTTLEQIVQRKGIETLLNHELIALRPQSREAVFRNLAENAEVALRYDLIHVTPPMGPPDFLAKSPLADADGWVNVDRDTLRHNHYPNVFSLGDCSSLPTSKTGAAIRKQAPVLVANLRAALRGEPPTACYDGYTSCPLVTGYNSLVLAEFDYDKKPAETFPWDQSRERFSSFLIKKLALPALYWHGMLKGRA